MRVAAAVVAAIVAAIRTTRCVEAPTPRVQRVWIGRRDTSDHLQQAANHFLQQVHARGGEIISVQYAHEQTSSTEVFSVCVVYAGTPDEVMAPGS